MHNDVRLYPYEPNNDIECESNHAEHDYVSLNQIRSVNRTHINQVETVFSKQTILLVYCLQKELVLKVMESLLRSLFHQQILWYSIVRSLMSKTFRFPTQFIKRLPCMVCRIYHQPSF